MHDDEETTYRDVASETRRRRGLGRPHCEAPGCEDGLVTYELERAYGDAPEPEWRQERCGRCDGTGYQPEPEEIETGGGGGAS